jgi:hypothetical protein
MREESRPTVAGHRLIDAQVTALARRLPADTVDELADGLTETYRHHLALGRPADAAARAAIAEFGDAEVIIAEFVRQAPGRRTARALLASGPVVGGAWAVALFTAHAWAWPVPAPIRVAFGVGLLAVLAALALAATARRSYRRTRIGAFGGLTLLLLDTGALACVASAPPAATVPLCIAVAASLTRVTLTARALPGLLTA